MGPNGCTCMIYAGPSQCQTGWGRSGLPNNLLKSNIKLLWGEIHMGVREIPGPPINVL